MPKSRHAKLFDDLNKTDVEAERLLETLIPAKAKQAGITEKLKVSDPMRCVGMTNSIKIQVKEKVWN